MNITLFAEPGFWRLPTVCWQIPAQGRDNGICLRRRIVPGIVLYFCQAIQRTGGVRPAGGSNLFLPSPKGATEPLIAPTFPSHRSGWQKSYPDKDHQKDAVDHLPALRHGQHWQVIYAKIAMICHLL
jgi:hypothetical protein